jgi:hypothetical protein
MYPYHVQYTPACERTGRLGSSMPPTCPMKTIGTPVSACATTTLFCTSGLKMYVLLLFLNFHVHTIFCDLSIASVENFASNLYYLLLPPTKLQIQNQLSFTEYKGTRLGADGTTEYHYVGTIHHLYRVYEEGWHNIDIQTCVDDSIYLSSRLQGEVQFKNPYGYVPAEQWGIIPFEVMCGLGCSIELCCYGCLTLLSII